MRVTRQRGCGACANSSRWARQVHDADPVKQVRSLKRSAVAQRRGARSPARLAVTLLALLAFALQSYVTQTHIHHASSVSFGLTFDAQAAKQNVSTPQPHDKYPANEDPSNCPICQEMLHAGQFVTPTALAVLAPALAVSFVALVIQSIIIARAVSHDWRGRAPPIV